MFFLYWSKRVEASLNNGSIFNLHFEMGCGRSQDKWAKAKMSLEPRSSMSSDVILILTDFDEALLPLYGTRCC